MGEALRFRESELNAGKNGKWEMCLHLCHVLVRFHSNNC